MAAKRLAQTQELTSVEWHSPAVWLLNDIKHFRICCGLELLIADNLEERLYLVVY